MHRLTARVAVLLVLALTVPARSQEPAGPSLLEQVVPHPTGKNGYERMVVAADLARSSQAWLALEGKPDATLADRRAVMADPRVSRALSTLRAAFDLPVSSPRAVVTEATTFPELAAFRSLTRLLNARIYVSFAAGDVPDALDWFRVGLLLGYHVQCESLISGLVGIAIDAMVTRSVSDHVEQLSAHDCERLLDICKKWIALPEPGERILLRERDLMLGIIERARKDPAVLRAVFEATGDDGDDATAQQAAEAATRDPQTTGRALDTIAAAVRAHTDALMAQFRRPVWERAVPPLPTVNDPNAQHLVSLFLPSQLGSQVLVKYATDFANVKLLAVHGAVRRYQWEHNRLPPSLAELRVGDLAIDPARGREFRYRTTGPRTYELAAQKPGE